MTNNEPRKRIGVEGHWVQFIDRQSKSDSRNRPDEGQDDRLTHCDLTKGHIEDLEVDSMLRQLAQCKSEHPDEFAEDVLAQLGFHESKDGKRVRSRDRLPVPDPIFDTEMEGENQTTSTEPVSHLWAQIFQRGSRSSQIAAVSGFLILSVVLTFAGMNFFFGDSGGVAKTDQNDSANHSVDDRSDDVDPAPNQLASDNGQRTIPDDSTPSVARTDDPDKSVGEANVLDNAVASDVRPAVGPPPVPEEPWRLAIEFDEYGMGKMRVNDRVLPTVAFRGNTGMLLRNISNAVGQRFHMLQPRLGSEIGGTISINDQEFPFTNPNTMPVAVKDATRFAAEMKLKPMSQADMLANRSQHMSRKDFLQFVADHGDNEASAESTRFGFATRDEAASIYSAISVTEKFLRSWAISVRDWQEQNSLDDEYVFETMVSANASMGKLAISQSDFDSFVEKGLLSVPDMVPDSMKLERTLQKLSQDELREQLRRSTRAFDVFRDQAEFFKAERIVQSNDHHGYSQQLTRLRDELHGIESSIMRMSAESDSSPKAEAAIAKLQTEYHEKGKKLEAFIVDKNLEPLKGWMKERKDLASLPLVMGDDCLLDDQDGKSLQDVSSTLGTALSQFDSFASRDKNNNDSWRYLVLKNAINQGLKQTANDQILRTMDQILQIDHPRLRMELIDFLRDTNKPVAIELLASRAKFDLNPEIRRAATQALSEFDSETYRTSLLDGFQYPWAPVAQHSAEALVQLKDDRVLDDLVKLLLAPSPTLPYQGKSGSFLTREVVAINHLKNCMLCHAPSTDRSDNGRAIVPNWSRPLSRSYYQGSRGAFVRADTTYLRQDFSVIQPVSKSKDWPDEQRFDYVVVEKKVTNEQARKMFADSRKTNNVHREAVVFALRELTGESPSSDTYATWAAIVARYKKQSGQK